MVRHKLNALLWLQNGIIYTVVLVIRKSVLDISAQEIVFFIPLPRNCYYIGKLDHSKQTFICTKPERAFIQLLHYRSTAPDNEKKNTATFIVNPFFTCKKVENE